MGRSEEAHARYTNEEDRQRADANQPQAAALSTAAALSALGARRKVIGDEAARAKGVA